MMRMVGVATRRALLSTCNLVVIGGGFGLACAEPAVGLARGEARYAQCAPCHGADGSGRPELEAPPIAGMPAWYVAAQIDKFKIGARGMHPDDAAGMRMRPMAKTLPSDDVDSVAQFVASLPRSAPATGVPQGAIAFGKGSYATCAACHGQNGEGNEALKAPPLAGMPEWYVAAQLRKFRSGARGAHPDDAQGAQMRPMALGLADDATVQNVAAFVASMSRR